VQVDAGGVAHGVAVLHDGPVAAEVEGAALERHLQRAVDLLQHGLHELLHEGHVVAVVPVRRVPLEHRELLQVRGVDALVAEVPAELVHAVERPGDHPLEVRLGRDAQEEVAVERVVVRGERPGRGARGGALQDGGLDLDEVVPVEELADQADDP
jgi:hypothetical protein